MIDSIPVAFIIPGILMILIPEIIYLSYLSQRSLSSTQIIARMKTQSKYLSMGLKMTEGWNPENIKSHIESSDKKDLEKKYSVWKIGTINFIFTACFLISSILTLILYFS